MRNLARKLIVAESRHLLTLGPYRYEEWYDEEYEARPDSTGYVAPTEYSFNWTIPQEVSTEGIHTFYTRSASTAH